MGYEYNFSSLKNNFESLSIKKNNLGNYILYGLMWWEYKENNKNMKSLVSIKSDNLIWDSNFSIESNNEYATAYGGRSNSPIAHFITSITRKIFYNFRFTNIMNNDVLVTLTVLNEGKDGFMKYNIYEGLDSYIVKVNVAGVKKNEIKVLLEDGIIRVRTRPETQVLEDVDVTVETFEPVKGDTEIYLPNIESVDAKLEDGILILTAPKKSKGIKIDIK
jgi:HSP20 family molecular chaperone IbpA